MKLSKRANLYFLSSFVLVSASLLANPASGQGMNGAGSGGGINKNALAVHVSDSTGGPLDESALVAVSSSAASYMQTSPTSQGGIATFSGMPAGEYTIKVSAAGYQSAQEIVNIELGRGSVESFISLTRTKDTSGAKTAPGVPLLAGDARTELDAAMKSLQANNVADATAHITIALRDAPGHPDVQYIAGLCALAQRDSASAQKYYEAAISIYPNHLGAQVGLGTLYLQQNDAANSIAHLEKAITIDANSWRAHWLVAEAYLIPGQTQDIIKGKTNANRALELGGDKSVDAQVTLARAEILSGEKDAARTRLEKFIHDYPNHTTIQRAQHMLNSLDAAPPVGAVKQ